jgi:WD40 repeat protein
MVWAANKGQPVRSFKLKVSGISVAFSPLGKLFACAKFGSQVKKGVRHPKYEVIVYNLETGKTVFAPMKGHTAKITQVVFSPDGLHLASSSLDGTVKVWDIATGKEVVTFHDAAPVLGVAFSPDSLRLASASEDHTVKLWATAGKKPRVMGPGIGCVVFSPDSKRLAGIGETSHGRYGAYVWNVATGKRLLRLEGAVGASRIAWSPDARRLAAGERGLVWDTTTGKICSSLRRTLGIVGSGVPLHAAWSRDGKFLAYVGGGKMGVCICETTTGRYLRTLPFEDRSPITTDYASCVAISPDSKLLAAGTSTIDTHFGRTPGLLKVWDLATEREVLVLHGFPGSVWRVAFSPDGKRLAAATGDYKSGKKSFDPQSGEVRVWDVLTGQQIWILKSHPYCVWSVAFSPDGKRLASAGGAWNEPVPGEVKIWDLNTGQEVCTLWHKAAVYDVAFSSCGRRLATVGQDGTVEVGLTPPGTVKIWDGTPLPEIMRP